MESCARCSGFDSPRIQTFFFLLNSSQIITNFIVNNLLNDNLITVNFLLDKFDYAAMDWGSVARSSLVERLLVAASANTPLNSLELWPWWPWWPWWPCGGDCSWFPASQASAREFLRWNIRRRFSHGLNRRRFPIQHTHKKKS